MPAKGWLILDPQGGIPQGVKEITLGIRQAPLSKQLI